MQDNLEQLEEIYLSDDIDDETRADNLSLIREWRSRLIKLEEYAGWKDHPVTQDIVAKAKKSYVDHSLLLARSRDLTDSARQSLWGKQDAMLWIISLTSDDAQEEISGIEMAITRALNDA